MGGQGPEPGPGPATWWGRWHRSFPLPAPDVGPLIAEELSGAISRCGRMLDDHARASHEVALQDA